MFLIHQQQNTTDTYTKRFVYQHPQITPKTSKQKNTAKTKSQQKANKKSTTTKTTTTRKANNIATPTFAPPDKQKTAPQRQ